MGLDMVEFVVALEGTFGIEIPDSDAVSLTTPRLLTDYLLAHLTVTDDAGTAACQSQRAFYRVRAAAVRSGMDRHSIHPNTLLEAVVGTSKAEWEGLRREVGSSCWPRRTKRNWELPLTGGVSTVGQLSEYLATYDAAATRDHDVAWSRSEVESLVVGILRADFGIDMSKFTMDSRFVRDMELDLSKPHNDRCS